MKLTSLFKSDLNKLKKEMQMKEHQHPLFNNKVTKKALAEINNVYLTNYFQAMKKLGLRLEYIGSKNEYVTVLTDKYRFNYAGKIHKTNKSNPFNVEIDILDAIQETTDVFSAADNNIQLYIGSNAKHFHLCNAEQCTAKIGYQVKSKHIEEISTSANQLSADNMNNICKFNMLRPKLANHLEHFTVRLIHRSNRSKYALCKACGFENGSNHFLDCLGMSDLLLHLTNNALLTGRAIILSTTNIKIQHTILLQHLWINHLNIQYNNQRFSPEESQELLFCSIGKQNRKMKANHKLPITYNLFDNVF